MHSIYDELRNLVRESRLFIQSQMPPAPRTPSKETQPLQKKVELSEKIIPIEIKEPVLPHLPPTPVRKIEKVSKGEWELHPMAQAVENLEWPKKLAIYTQTCVPEIVSLLLLPEENGVHRLFLENISRALTRTYGPSSVLKYEEKMWKKINCKYILAPCTLLKKKFPKAEPHSPLKEEGRILIPMENLDLYGHDVQAKRVLWTTIQHLFQS